MRSLEYVAGYLRDSEEYFEDVPSLSEYLENRTAVFGTFTETEVTELWIMLQRM